MNLQDRFKTPLKKIENTRKWNEIKQSRPTKEEIENRKKRAFAMFNQGIVTTEATKYLDVHPSTVCNWFSEWLLAQRKQKRPVLFNKVSEPYWKDEKELEKSFNLEYKFEDLSDQEKELWQKV